MLTYSMIENLLTFLASSGCPQMTTPKKLVLNLSPKISFQSHICCYTDEDPENMEKLRKDTEVLQWDGCSSISIKQNIKSEGGSLSAVPKGSSDLPQLAHCLSWHDTRHVSLGGCEMNMSRLFNDVLVTGAFPDQKEDELMGSMRFRTCKVGI